MSKEKRDNRFVMTSLLGGASRHAQGNPLAAQRQLRPPENGVHRAATPEVRAWAAEVAQNLGLVTAALFQGVCQDR
jgi:hypothetical protein